MKVLYIIHSCNMDGATISFINLIRGLSLEGIAPIIVHPEVRKENLDLIKTFEDIGAKCYTLDIPVSYISSNAIFIKKMIKPLFIKLKIKKFCKKLENIVKTENPSIIHTNTGVVHGGYYVARKLKIPHVWHLREYQTLDFNWNIIPSINKFKKELKDSYTVCITKEIQRYFGLAGFTKSIVIYNPAISLSEIKEKKQHEQYFLVANRVSKEKGMGDIIEAFSEFAKHNNSIDLRIAGFGKEEYISQLKEKCKSLGITNRVKFLGYCNNVQELMRSAIALIVASYAEGFGRMTAEANMIGLPVIGRNTAGTKEIIEQTKGGVLFNNKSEFIQSMEKICAMNESEIKEFMKAPQIKAKSLFSSEQHIEEIKKVYNKALHKEVLL